MNNGNTDRDDMLAGEFVWFTGVIEDILDPEQRGRVRVRCFGYHTEQKNLIPTTALPWANVMLPITSGAQSGVGQSATGLLRGTWVIGFFRDGATAQDPLVIGSLPAVTPSVDYEFGFSDPTEQYPYESMVDQPDIPEEAISKDDKYKESFTYKKKQEHRDAFQEIPVALNPKTWSLPPLKEIIKVEYPKNHVHAYERTVPIKKVEANDEKSTGILDQKIEKKEKFEGSFGLDPKKTMHVEEHDDTPDFERISSMHKSGTYREWTPKGDETVVIVGDEYRIIASSQKINIEGDAVLTIAGDYHRLVMGDEYIHVKGNRTEVIGGMLTQNVGLNKTITVTGLHSITANALSTASLLGGIDEVVGGSKTSTVAGSLSQNVIGNVTNLTTGIKLDHATKKVLELGPDYTPVDMKTLATGGGGSSEPGVPGVPGPIGPRGRPGTTGEAGQDGADGQDGAPGAPGADGQDGAPGADGQDGAPGAPGAPGADGQDGAPGADGLGWTSGSYDPVTGIVTFTSDDGLGFVTTDLRGEDGTDGQDGAPGADGQDGAPGLPGADGQDGADGLSTFQISIFHRSASTPASPTGGQYNFSTSALTPPSGWTIETPAGTDPIWVSHTIASVIGTGIDTTLTWTTPVQFVSNGADGVDGTDGSDGADGLSNGVFTDATLLTALDDGLVIIGEAAPKLEVTVNGIKYVIKLWDYTYQPPQIVNYENIVFEIVTTTSNETVMLPVTGLAGAQINWLDNSLLETTSSDYPTHEYAVAGTHYAQIQSGIVNSINGGGTPTYMAKIKKILSFGSHLGLQSLNAINLLSGITHIYDGYQQGITPDLSLSMTETFSDMYCQSSTGLPTSLIEFDLSGVPITFVSNQDKLYFIGSAGTAFGSNLTKFEVNIDWGSFYNLPDDGNAWANYEIGLLNMFAGCSALPRTPTFLIDMRDWFAAGGPGSTLPPRITTAVQMFASCTSFISTGSGYLMPCRDDQGLDASTSAVIEDRWATNLTIAPLHTNGKGRDGWKNMYNGCTAFEAQGPSYWTYLFAYRGLASATA